MPGLDIRGDKIMTTEESKEFLDGEILIEEKVDGANIGFSFNENQILRIQNRGKFITSNAHPQFELIQDWLSYRLDLFSKYLGSRYILFGEWCYAKHTVQYKSLPDWFLGFDVFDREEEAFLSSKFRNSFFENLNISPIPELDKGIFTKEQLASLLKNGNSEIGGDSLEGLYLRKEGSSKLLKRAKLVRSDFIQNITLHWRMRRLERNTLAPTSPAFP